MASLTVGLTADLFLWASRSFMLPVFENGNVLQFFHQTLHVDNYDQTEKTALFIYLILKKGHIDYGRPTT